MDDKTLVALQRSIKHWEENTTALQSYEASISTKDCALCSLFHPHNCLGCPVAGRIGRGKCRGSPYVVASRAFYNWDDGGRHGDKFELARARFHKAAQAEVEFLKSLLPKGVTS